MKSLPLDTETRILRSATKLFGERGFSGVSLREILVAAEANIASAHYYFGSKKDLFKAASEQFVIKISTQRMENLNALQSKDGFSPDDVEDILKAYITPHFAVATEAGGEGYLMMLSRFQSEERKMSIPFFAQHFGPSRTAYLAALEQALNLTNEDKLYRSFSIFVSSMLIAPFDYGYMQLQSSAQTKTDYSVLSDMLVCYSAAGMKALCRD